MPDNDNSKINTSAQVIDFEKNKGAFIHQKKEQRFKELQNAFKKALKLNGKKVKTDKKGKKSNPKK